MDENFMLKMRGIVREEVNGLREQMATKGDLKNFATKEDFLAFAERLSSTIEHIRVGVRLSFGAVERELREIKNKLSFYDFDYLVKQNDATIKILKDMYEEKTIMSGQLKNHETRLEAIEKTSEHSR